MSDVTDEVVQLHLKPVSLPFEQGDARQDKVSLAAVRNGACVVQVE